MISVKLDKHLGDASSAMAHFSTRSDGNMLRTNANRVEVHGNREAFLNIASSERRPVRVRTSHSANIDFLTMSGRKFIRTSYIFDPAISADFDYYLDGSDGIIADDSSISLYLISGDCLPVILWQPSGSVIGMIHVGLLGALNGMAESIPNVLTDNGIDLDSIRFLIGPSIGKTDYDISKSGLFQAIQGQVERSPVASARIDPFLDGSKLNLAGMVEAQIVSAGAAIDAVSCYPGSTASIDSPFFSNYVAKQQGEQAGAFCSLIRAGNAG